MISGSRRKRSTRRTLAGVRVDSLEARCLLAVATVNGTSGPDQITLTRSGNSITATVNGVPTAIAANSIDGIVVNAGDGIDTVRVSDVGDEPTTIDGGAADDTLFVGNGSWGTTVTADVSVVGGAGNDILTLDGSAASSGLNVSIDNPLNTYIAFSKATSGSVFADVGTAASAVDQVLIQAFGGGADTFAVNGTSSLQSVTIQSGNGNDTITVGDDIDNKILGALMVDGGSGTNTLNIDDSADSANDIFTFAGTPTVGTIAKNSGGATISYATIQALSVTGGEAGLLTNQRFNINAIPAVTSTTINGGAGDDTVRIGDGTLVDLDTFDAPLTFNGGDDMDRIEYLDSITPAASTYTVDTTTITNAGTATVTYNDVEQVSIQGGTAGDTMRVTSTANANFTAISVTLNGGAGGDTFLVGNGDVDASLSNGVSVIGGAGSDTLTVDDALDDVGGDTYFFVAGGMTRGQRGVAWSTSAAEATDFVTLLGSAQNDVISVTGGGANVRLRINGGGGNDRFNLSNTGGSSAPPVTVNSGSGTDTIDVNSDNSGSDAFAEVDATLEDVAELDIRTGGRLTITPTATGNVGRVLAARTTLLLNGILDVADQTMIVGGTANFATLNTRAATGFNNGTWTVAAGPAIVSSVAATATRSDGVGVVLASAIGTPTFAGTATTANDVVVRYTFNGDTNLDRTVNFTDLLSLAQSYDAAVGGKTWVQGNFNYNAGTVAGSTAFDDLLALAQNYGVTLVIPQAASAVSAEATSSATRKRPSLVIE